MKRLISLFLTVILIFSLVSCDSEPDKGSKSSGVEKVSLSVICINTDYSRNFVRII